MNDSKEYKNTWWYRLSHIIYVVVFGGFGLLVLIFTVEKNIPEFWEHEERRIVNIINSNETGETITRADADLLESLPENQYQEFKKDWFKEENSELLLAYKKNKKGETITRAQANLLEGASNDLYAEVEEAYYDEIKETDLLIITKNEKDLGLTQEQADRLNSLDENYYRYLVNEFYKKESRMHNNFIDRIALPIKINNLGLDNLVYKNHLFSPIYLGNWIQTAYTILVFVILYLVYMLGIRFIFFYIATGKYKLLFNEFN